MKQMIRRAGALFLAAALLTTSVYASYAMGDELHKTVTPLASGVTLTKQLMWSNSKSDLRTERYVTYTPGTNLAPTVAYGDTVLSKQTVGSMAKGLESTGKRVLSGANGDYFDMGTGNPLGILITDGVLRSSPSSLSAIGFTSDGHAVIGKPDLSIQASFSGHQLKVENINKVRGSNGFHLMNSDFGTSTKNTQPGIDVILSPVTDNLGAETTLDNGQTVIQSDVLKIGGRMSFVVDQVIQSTGSLEIPQGKYIMTLNNNGGEWIKEVLSALVPGDTMDITITSSNTQWNNVTCAVGAMHRILTDGVVGTGINDASTNASRTAIGVKPDGNVIFYTIDGRQNGYSIGSTITQVAERLKELGCVNAVCLDGGGSTTLGATTPNGNSFEIVNKPSEGSQRAVTNALFLVSTLSPSGSAAHLYVTPKDEALVGGASTTFSTSFVDDNWYPATSSEPVSYRAEKGSFDDAGTYIAPLESCVDTITATTSSGVTGSTTVTVFASPNAIRVTNTRTNEIVSSLALSAGESVSLAATATYQKIPLATNSGNFTWSVEPADLGTITHDGTFTAESISGSGHIKVTSGSHTASIPLTISGDGRFATLDDFESDTLPVTSVSGATVTQETAADQVRFGKKSLRWDYDLTSDASQLSSNITVGSTERYLSLWVYGNNSGATLEAIGQDASGQSYRLSFGEVNFTGWKQLWASLPANPASLTGFTLSGGSQTTGTIWVDQLCSANMNKADSAAPTVTLTVNGDQLSAQVKDNADTGFIISQLSLTVNGKDNPFAFDESSSTLTATLPVLEGALHRVTVQATDHSGNVGRASQTLAGSSVASPFADMGGHWAISYTDCLSSLNIINGMEEGGKLYFHPNRSITRGDFALMTARWMGLDLTAYSSVELPFSDTDKIPAWSQDAIKAMYELGIMKGVENQGKLYANAQSNITRAEAMTILGRIQVKGYPGASLTQFTDAGSVPSWASSYIASLVGQKVVGGYEDNTLRVTNSVSRAEVAKMLFTIW